MKKNFFKKLSLGLALALVVGTTAQAGTAKAAETWALKQASKTLFMNKEDSTWDFNFKKLPKDWKKLYDFEWTTGNSKVATVAKGGVVTAVSVGETTVDCTVTEKDGGKVVATASSKVVVKANAAEVVITNVENGYVAYVGESIDLDRAMYDENGNKTTKRGVYVTDYTRWSAYTMVKDENGELVQGDLVEDAEVVAIDSKTGTFTMKKAGTYALVVETYQSSKNSETTAADAIIVVVEDEFAVEQNKDNAELNQIDIVFAAPIAKDAFTGVKAEDVAVNVLESVGTQTIERSQLVKSADAVYNEDKTAVIGVKVILWNKLENNKTYAVTYNDETTGFIASVGVPVNIEIKVVKNGNVNAVDSNVVFVETEGKVENNKLEVIYRDAYGVNVTKEVRNGEEEWSFLGNDDFVEYDDVERTITADEEAAGNNYVLSIVYEDETEDGVKIEAKGELAFHVSAVAEMPLEVVNVSTVVGATSAPEYKADRSPNKVAINDEGIYIAVSAKDAWGNKVDNNGSELYDLRFEIADPERGYVDETTGEFQPYKTGAAIVNVFYTDVKVSEPKEKYLTTVRVYVYGDREPGKLVEQGDTTVSLTANVLYKGTEKVTEIEETATFYFTLADNHSEITYKEFDKNAFTIKGVSDEVIDAIDVTYDADKKAYKLTVTNTELIPEITNDKTVDKADVSVKITVGFAENEKISPLEFTVKLTKPKTLEIKKYSVEVGNINAAGKNSSNGSVELVVYALNSKGVKVAKIDALDAYLMEDIDKYVKANNGVVAAEELFAGATSGSKLVYTITDANKKLVKADGNATAEAVSGGSVKVKGQVMEGFTDAISFVGAEEVDDLGNIIYYAKAGKYKVTVYQITKTTNGEKISYKKTEMCSASFEVTNTLPDVKWTQTNTVTEKDVNVVNDGKLTWTYDETIKDAVTDCFTFKLGNTDVSADAKAFQVRVSANGKSVYVKSVRVFCSVGNDEYVAVTLDVNKTITIAE